MLPFKFEEKVPYAVANIWLDDNHLYEELYSAVSLTCLENSLLMEKSDHIQLAIQNLYKEKHWLPGIFITPSFGSAGDYSELALYTTGITRYRNILSLQYTCADADVTGEWFCQWISNTLSVKIAWRYSYYRKYTFSKILVPEENPDRYKLKTCKS